MTKAVTLESLQQSIDDISGAIKDLAQFTSDGFDKLGHQVEKLEKRADSVDATLREHTAILNSHTSLLNDHTSILRDHTSRSIQIQASIDNIAGEQEAHNNDIKEIFAILDRLEKDKKISIADKKDAEIRLNRVISWAKEASVALGIPLKL